MKSRKFSLKWWDAVNAIIITLIGQALLIIMQAADGTFPSLNDFKVGLIGSIKFAIIPYLLKNFFTNDIRVAQEILSDAKAEGIEAASKIPPSIAPNDEEQQNKL